MTATIATLNRAGGLTPAQVDLLTRTICKGADEDELALFLSVCNRTGLDPFMRQIHAVFRYDSAAGRKAMTIQVGIDGYRLLADRTGAYAGSDDPVYEDGDGHPVKASVTVWRLVGGVRCPFTASARWSEYRQDKSPMWTRMPYLMLGKVAEALALRKAFPAELSGLYTREEMDQAADGVIVDGATGEIMESAPPPRPQITAAANLDKLRESYARGVAKAADLGLLAPSLPDDADEVTIRRMAGAIQAAIKTAEGVGYPAAYRAALARNEWPAEDLRQDIAGAAYQADPAGHLRETMAAWSATEF